MKLPRAQCLGSWFCKFLWNMFAPAWARSTRIFGWLDRAARCSAVHCWDPPPKSRSNCCCGAFLACSWGSNRPMALMADSYPLRTAVWIGAQLSKFFLLTWAPLLTSKSRMYEHLSGFLENMFMIRWIGVLPSESCLFKSAFLLTNDSIIAVFY